MRFSSPIKSKHGAHQLLIVFAAIALFTILLVRLWPPDPWIAALLAGLAVLLGTSFISMIRAHARASPYWINVKGSHPDMSDSDSEADRLRKLAEYERRLVLRELRLARQTHASHFVHDDYIDVVQSDLSDAELDALGAKDRELVALIEVESQLVFDRILQNRYAADDGVNTELILKDVKSFVGQVAKLYGVKSDEPLLETDIELVAKSLSSASLHMLIVVDALPLDLKSYNTAKMYRLIRRGASYYGTYKAFRPYMEHGLNALQIARLALGMNPVTVGATWLAGKLTSYSARTIGERVLRRRALQLINEFVRVIGYEAAMMYGGSFRHRDANWVLGAHLVNLEVSRNDDLGGRDLAIRTICNLVMRHEFDRIYLLSHLGRHKRIVVEHVRPQVVLTEAECRAVAAALAEHCHKTNVNFASRGFIRWQKAAEDSLSVKFRIPTADSPEAGVARERSK